MTILDKIVITILALIVLAGHSAWPFVQLMEIEASNGVALWGIWGMLIATILGLIYFVWRS